MLVSLTNIYLNPKDRLRHKHQNVKDLAASIARRGQIQPIVLRPPWEGEESGGKEWVITAGARRFLAFLVLQPLYGQEDVEIHASLEPGKIEVIFRHTDDDLMALEVEFHENEDRDNFDWKDKTSYVCRIHEGHMALDPEWDVNATAALLDMGKSMVYYFLEFGRNKEIMEDKRLQEAESFRTAAKQFDIVKKLREREMVVEHKAKRIAERKKELAEMKELVIKQSNGLSLDEPIFPGKIIPLATEAHELAERICAEGDCREWIKKIDSNSVDFVHWDPPYGGEQSGGANTAFSKIDDSWDNARHLLKDMMPEIYRVLKDGHWMAIWCHPAFIQDVSRLVSGHSLDMLGQQCIYCEKRWDSANLDYYCPGGPWSFWTNPYPNHWYKVDRRADGHEIKRFLINAEEPFLFAAKVGSDLDPILPRSDRQNVFTFKMVDKGERRHVMHKPRKLLHEVLSCISIPGEFGIDPSYGSGSIFEAALDSGRRMVGCELSHDDVLTSREVIEKIIDEKCLVGWEGL